MSKLVALVDDDNDIRDVAKAILESAGYRVDTFGNAWEFLKSCD
ncbi:MAG: two-component system response regulator, partial [Candidatus Sericytochromatia bacterium]|nr:two-component system response regulator [Candidatus Tanganyikabacteria bacterium]